MDRDELTQLVNELVITRDPEKASSLSGLLAGAANDEARAPWVAPLVVRTLGVLAEVTLPSPWPRLNLCTALDRILIFGALAPELGRPIPQLGRFLDESMDSDVLVRAVAALVFYQLVRHGFADAISEPERTEIERKVLSSVNSTDDELAEYAQMLRDFLARSDAG